MCAFFPSCMCHLSGKPHDFSSESACVILKLSTTMKYIWLAHKKNINLGENTKDVLIHHFKKLDLDSPLMSREVANGGMKNSL